MNSPSPRQYRRFSTGNMLIIVLAGFILGVWLTYTPPGVLGKANAIGYAVCHQISTRSFFLGDHQLPLCSRCSGMYLGALVGLIYQIRLGRFGGIPARKILFVLGTFLLAFAIDGINSYLHFFPGTPTFYEPHNWLRLLTGTGVGLGISAVLLPIFNQTVWKDWDDHPLLYSWRQLFTIILLAIVMDIAILSENAFLLYPLALLSSATVLLILTMLYTVIWILLLRKDNHYQTLNDLSGLLIAGFTTALLQIALMDLGRYILTGTWKGFPSGL
jgi:uncharacterized membrane protein